MFSFLLSLLHGLSPFTQTGTDPEPSCIGGTLPPT